MKFIVKKYHLDGNGKTYNVGDTREIDNQHAIFHLKKYGLISDVEDGEEAEKATTPAENKAVKPTKNK